MITRRIAPPLRRFSAPVNRLTSASLPGRQNKVSHFTGISNPCLTVQTEISSVVLPFIFIPRPNRFQGDAREMIPNFITEGGASHLVTDFSLLREIRSCRDEVPPPGKGSLYNRLFLMGTEAVLDLALAPEYTFLAYLCFSCGNYFKVVQAWLVDT
ncbi:hypothetical protein DY000_02045237 [Brassica cretica]|uniref:Uncharacterized protein n=1 Tax=Brassica cretica TaxID=69181 RepID=A0ABQ7EPU5_BRACR|nr:hypothetical protein DY000_02045237 [Brassica cretica]